MCTSSLDELLSFISKFVHMTSLGINANLNVNSFHGNLSLTFKVDLGSVLQKFTSNAASKTSKLRRRRRRENVRRNNHCISQAVNPDCNHNEIEVDDTVHVDFNDIDITTTEFEDEDNTTTNYIGDNTTNDIDEISNSHYSFHHKDIEFGDL